MNWLELGEAPFGKTLTRFIAAAWLLLGMIAMPDSVRAQPLQWPVASGGNGRYYEVRHSPVTCWTDARALAIAQGGDLATINSPDEQQFILGVLTVRNPPTGAYFINLVETNPETYIWANGEPSTFTFWFPGEPNDGFGGIEDVGSLLWTQSQPNNGRSGYWNDVPNCIAGIPGYVDDYGPGGYIVEYPCEAVVLSHPISRETCPLGSAAFIATVGTAAGAGPFIFRWQVEAAPMGSNVWTDLTDGPVPGGSGVASDSGTDTLTVSNTQVAPAVRFRCRVMNACGSVDSNPATLTIVTTGDMNCDCTINGLDIALFVQALLNPAVYVAAHPGCNILHGDINGDLAVDQLDIQSFASCSLAGTCP